MRGSDRSGIFIGLSASMRTPQRAQALPGQRLVRCLTRDEVGLVIQCTLVKLQVPMLCMRCGFCHDHVGSVNIARRHVIKDYSAFGSCTGLIRKESSHQISTRGSEAGSQCLGGMRSLLYHRYLHAAPNTTVSIHNETYSAKVPITKLPQCLCCVSCNFKNQGFNRLTSDRDIYASGVAGRIGQ